MDTGFYFSWVKNLEIRYGKVVGYVHVEFYEKPPTSFSKH